MTIVAQKFYGINSINWHSMIFISLYKITTFLTFKLALLPVYIPCGYVLAKKKSEIFKCTLFQWLQRSTTFIAFTFLLFQMTTKSEHLMRSLAPHIAARKCIYRNKWLNFVPKLQCQCSQVCYYWNQSN